MRRSTVAGFWAAWLAVWWVVWQMRSGLAHHLGHMGLRGELPLPLITEWTLLPVIGGDALSTGQQLVGGVLWGLALIPPIVGGVAAFRIPAERLAPSHALGFALYLSYVVGFGILLTLGFIAPMLYL